MTTVAGARVYDGESAPEAHAFYDLTCKLAMFLSDRRESRDGTRRVGRDHDHRHRRSDLFKKLGFTR